MRLNLLLACPMPTDGTSFYRAVQPFSELRREGYDIEFKSFTEYNWTSLSLSDLVFIQRAYLPKQLDLALQAKNFGLPIWVDYDDDLTCLPADNPTHDMYMQPAIQENIRKIVNMADVITVSTPDLADTMEGILRERGGKGKVRVCPNGINTRLFPRMTHLVDARNVVMWRGSGTHMQDLMAYQEAIMDCYSKNKDWTFVFMGYNPFWITSKMDKKRYQYVPWIDTPINMLKTMQRTRSAIQIVPLENNKFNKGKSRIAHLEASCAGSVCLGPNWREWQGGDIARYDNQDGFYKELNGLMNNSIMDLAKRNHRDWQWVEENRSLKVANKIRIDVLKELGFDGIGK